MADMAHLASVLTDWLDRGLVTPMEQLTHLATLRQRGGQDRW
jgi:hypothetical protein